MKVNNRGRSPQNCFHLGLGSNLGDRAQNLLTAITEIAKFAKILKQSSIYETEPISDIPQEKFLNMAIEIETEYSPLELIFRLEEIEHKMGRKKETEGENAPRIIDLDILLNEDKKFQQKNLIVPHPRMTKRLFVLAPLAEIAAQKIHPILQESIENLLKKVNNQSAASAQRKREQDEESGSASSETK